MYDLSLSRAELLRAVVADAFRTAVTDVVSSAQSTSSSSQSHGQESISFGSISATYAAELSDLANNALGVGGSAPSKPAPKPKPTGVRPRILLLPSLVLAIMAIPIVGIFLPVFITAGQQRDTEADKRMYAGVAFPASPEVRETCGWCCAMHANVSVASLLHGMDDESMNNCWSRELMNNWAWTARVRLVK